MSDDTHERETASRIRELPAVQARAAFQAELKRAFASGALPAPAEETRTPVPDRRRAWWWELRPLWAAVVLGMLLGAGAMLNRGPEPVVIGHPGAGIVHVDGVAVDVTDPDAWSTLRAGSEIRTGAEGPVEILYAELAVLEIAPRTTVTLPASPGRWLGKSVDSRLDVGELRFMSGPRFVGNLLAVTTPEGRAEITGTTVSVQSDSTGTCVCVLSGHVRVGVDEADMEIIPPGFRKVMPRDGEPHRSPVKAMHEAGVRRFTDAFGETVSGTD